MHRHPPTPPFRPALIPVLLIALIALPAFGCQMDPRPRRVAVMEFEIAIPGDNNQHHSRTVPELLTASLSNDKRIGVVERYDVQQGLAAVDPGRDPQKLQRLGRQLNADYLVEGSLSKLEDNYILNARLFSVATGETVPGTSYFKSFQREEDLYPSIQSVSRFMAYQVANYDKRVQLAEKARTDSARSQNQ